MLFDPPHFLVLRDACAPRPCGFAADVYDVRSICDHPFGVRPHAPGRAELPTIAKAIRREVDDAHHERALAYGEHTSRKLPFTNTHHKAKVKRKKAKVKNASSLLPFSFDLFT